ncbi:MAG: hypothetical protein HN368_18195, partial [Spirochaetales bacterium]|nr:hypothetical protein [Spirochaetales bacterium]
MKRWDYISEFYDSDLNKTRSLDDCACPSFFKLGSKWVLLYISHYNGVQYYVGEYSGGKFFPEKHEKMNWPGGVFFAVESLLDDRDRRIIWGWVPETRSRATQHASGWSGVMSMPRVVSMTDDGQINVDPPEEFERLRLNYRKLVGLQLYRSYEALLNDISGDSLELLMRVGPLNEARFGIKVRCSPDGQEESAILYDSEKATITIDTRKSSLCDDIVQPFPYPWAAKMPDIDSMVPPFSRNGEHTIKNVFLQEVPFSVEKAERLQLRVYIDRSILEIYLNSRICVTQRIYPSRKDSTGVKLFCEMGNVHVESLEAWDIAATNHW